MKKLLFSLLLFCGIAGQAQTEKYSRIRIIADETQMLDLVNAGLALDHGEMKRGHWFISDFSATEIAIIKEKGIGYEVLIDDVKQYYKDQNKPENQRSPDPAVAVSSIGCNVAPVYTTPSNFTLGSMGGFFTYSEILWHMDNLATLFPALVKAKLPISATNTIGGRPLYWMKISDNPNVDEAEPEVLYNSAHHAREPASVSQLILYMYYLCENYATDPEVQYLVNNSEMYFVPLTNPDGYVYNQTTDPSGGGMWRKNRRNNGGGSYGVDINRNYSYMWAYDGSGSSGSGFSESYRGTAAFSEAESQNMRDFMNSRSFRLSLNNHTYGNLLIYSYGYAPFTCPDSNQFIAFGSHLTTYNKYSFGTAPQTVLYPTNGTIDDWQFGDTGKPKIYGMTPEAGRSDEGFWPPISRIVDICKENIWQNMHMVHLALKYAVVTDEEPNYVPASGYFSYRIRCLGLDVPANFTVTITPAGTAISVVGPPKTYTAMNHMDEIYDSISYTLNPLVPGDVVKYIISVNNGTYTVSDTITKRFGTPVIVFASDGNAMTGWTSSTWGTTTSAFHSSTASITDSPFGDYNDNETRSISTISNLDLTNAVSAQMVFWGKWEVETNYDYAQALVSVDNGVTWSPLCGHLTKTGNGYQDPGQPLYDAYKKSWLKEEIPLDDYVGQNIKVGFRVVTDNGGNADGFYFDDLKVEKIAASTVGINENDLEMSLSQNMPNPAGEYTYINYSSKKDSKLLIYNSVGQVVKEESITSGRGNVKLDVSNLAPGVYTYVMWDGKVRSGAQRMSVIR